MNAGVELKALVVTDKRGLSFSKVSVDLLRALRRNGVEAGIADFRDVNLSNAPKNLICFSSLLSDILNYAAKFSKRRNVILYLTAEGRCLTESTLKKALNKNATIIAVSKYVKSKIEEQGLKCDGVIPHGCLSPDTKIWVKSDTTVGLREDGVGHVKVKGVWKIYAMEPLVRIVTKKRELKITRDNLVLTSRGWIPAADVRVGDRLAVVRDEVLDLYPSMNIKEYVDTYETLVSRGDRVPEEELQTGKRKSHSGEVGKKLRFGYKESTQVEVENKNNPDEGTLDGARRRDVKEALSDNSQLRVSENTRQNEVCHSEQSKQVGVEEKNKKKDQDVYEEGIAPTGGLEVGVHSGTNRWGGNGWYSSTAQRSLLSQSRNLQLKQRSPRNDKEVAESGDDNGTPLIALGEDGVQVLPRDEPHLSVASKNSTILGNKEEAMRSRAEVLGVERGEIFSRPIIGRGKGDYRNNQGVEYEEVIEVKSTPLNGLVYDLITETHNFVANGVIVHNCDLSVKPDLEWASFIEDQTKGKTILLAIAENGIRKALDRLLLIFKIIHHAVPDTFLILHTNSNGFYPVRSIARGFQLEDVWITDLMVPELALTEQQINALYYLAAKTRGLYLCTSYSEGFCLPVIESFKYGLPVVSPALPPIVEVVGESKAGMLLPITNRFEVPWARKWFYDVNDYSIDAYVDAVLTALFKPKLYDEMREDALKIGRKFDMYEIYRRFVEWLK